MINNINKVLLIYLIISVNREELFVETISIFAETHVWRTNLCTVDNIKSWKVSDWLTVSKMDEWLSLISGRAIAQVVSCWLPGFEQVRFVVDRVALGQVFSECFGFPCQFSFHQLLHNHPHLSSGAGTIGQKWPQHKGLRPTPLALKKNMNRK
jgi:hypothetical protein